MRPSATLLGTLLALTACVEDQGFPFTTSKLTVQVRLVDQTLEIERLPEGREQIASEARATSWLAYSFTSPDGQTLREGRVPDPRSQRIEWEEERAIHESVQDGDFGSFVLTLPNASGELVVREERPEGLMEIGRAPIDAADGSSHTLGLSSDGAALPVEYLGATLYPHQTSVDILFLPEGYRADQMEDFHAAVRRVSDALLARPDWGRYPRSFNILMQDVPSAEAGVDDGQVLRNTAFDSALRPIEGSTGEKVKVGSAEGEALIQRLASRARADAVVVVANAPREFRSSAGSLVMLSPADPRTDVLPHELGHKLLKLGDEYVERGDICGLGGQRQPPNVSFSADRSRLPWADMVLPDTPLPTPPREGDVGAYQGAWFCGNAFRPAPDCMMRSNHPAACPVCQREMERFMAAYINPEPVPDAPSDPPLPGDEPGTSANAGGTEPPGAWTCQAGYWGGGDGCDCGCGAVDTDCGTGGCSEPGCFEAACGYCYDAGGSPVACAPSAPPQDNGENGAGGGPQDGDSGYDEGGTWDPCSAYDWSTLCLAGDGLCHEGDGCCGYDPDNHDGTCFSADGQPQDDHCAGYDRNIYCVPDDDYCDQWDGCCAYDPDIDDGGPCRVDGDDGYVSEDYVPDQCGDYDWTTHCHDGDDYCDEDDGCCEDDLDDHDGGPCLNL